MYEEGYQIAVVEHHYNDTFANADSQGRIGTLGINLYPTLMPDGLPEPQYPYTHAILETTINERLAAESPCTIELSGSIEGNELSLDVNIIKEAGSDMPNPRLQVVITETDIPYNDPNYNNHMNFVDRDMVPDHLGTDFDFDGDTANLNINTTLDQNWVQDNIIIVVFVEDGSNHHVFQTTKSLLSEFYTEANENNITPVAETLSNFPNPFNPSTNIVFSVKDNIAKTTLIIYNQRGQKVKTLLNKPMQFGSNEIVWNGIDDNGNELASGVYFVKMNNGNYVQSNKMILMK